MRYSIEPRVSVRRIKIELPRWNFRPGDIVEVWKGFPEPGQYVALDLATGFEIGIYRKRHIELHNGLRLIGQGRRIMGVIFLASKSLLLLSAMIL